ncbi:MAG: sodium:proline symporter [Deltaproteobacteria bacterium]|nr:MAG: sodium:proline symporter [Deltaproteobacteria bacterium]
MLAPLDIAVILAWLGLSVAAGLWFARRASGSAEDFFAAGRSLPWWVVGTSMVATTFAADTPLAVSGWVATHGIAENWVWWTFGLTGMVSVFLFAPLWRRSGVLTDAELVELRYGPGTGRWLRSFKAIWFGVFYNGVVLAWVIKAMVKIGATLLGVNAETPARELWPALAVLGDLSLATILVGAMFVFTVIYTAASGLWGVVVTDLMQFVLAIGTSVVLALVAWQAVGGLPGLQEGFSEHGFDWSSTVALIPTEGGFDGAAAGLAVLLGLLWWSGTNSDGSGYLAQRLFAAKDERHAVWAYLWFTIAHLVLRPWPWILVGLAGMAMLGPVEDAETYYPRMMIALLPAGALGLMVASFLAAFMSTVDTHLNWGASLIVNDVWHPLARRWEWPAHEVRASRISVVLLAGVGAVASFAIADIGTAWKLALSVTAGIGAVYMARWLWWRINAWSEISTMASAAVLTLVFSVLAARHPDLVEGGAWPWLDAVPAGWLSFPFSAGLTVLFSVPLALIVTLLTPPVDPATLATFAARVRPGGPGWPAHLRGPSLPVLRLLAAISSAVVCIYGALLGTGWVLLGELWWGLPALALALGCAPLTGILLRQHTAEVLREG